MERLTLSRRGVPLAQFVCTKSEVTFWIGQVGHLITTRPKTME